ncbi:MAG: hypothetical protein EOP49_47085 [Sphingobacteriales bacterium]|nr:MAG: hypothetical protein EOP49_47085 [Sphingobacteriales bacterium]
MDKPQPIPEQHTGGQTDTRACVTLPTEAAAALHFGEACRRLKHVNDWQQVCGSDATHFALFDSEGQAADREARVGDYLRINIPGPGTSAGEGYDWVQVEEAGMTEDEAQRVCFIRVRPAVPPLPQEDNVAHFFTDEATSTFLVHKDGLEVSAEVHGRNEKPNVGADRIGDKVRNALVGTASLLGFSLPQWKMLVTGLVKLDAP